MEKYDLKPMEIHNLNPGDLVWVCNPHGLLEPFKNQIGRFVDHITPNPSIGQHLYSCHFKNNTYMTVFHDEIMPVKYLTALEKAIIGVFDENT